MKKELLMRKNIKLQGYDYSQAGYYFLTICINGRHKMSGKVVGNARRANSVRDGVPQSGPGVPYVELNEIGKMIKQHIDKMSVVYSSIKVDKYIIMPNHIHMIIAIENSNITKTNGTSSRTEFAQCAFPIKSILAKIINAFKSLTSRQFGESIWQRSYHDHIIRNETEYNKIWQYMDENPARWKEDKYYV